MVLFDALFVMYHQHCSIFLDKEGSKEQVQICPTKNLDEFGKTYIKKLSRHWLDTEVTKIQPTAFGFANIYVEVPHYEDIRPVGSDGIQEQSEDVVYSHGQIRRVFRYINQRSN